MRPDFSKIKLGAGSSGNAKATGDIIRESPEEIDIKTVYAHDDLSDSEHLGFVLSLIHISEPTRPY